MARRRLFNEMCWCGASLLAVGAFGFVLAWIDSTAAHPLSPSTGLLVLSAASIVIMIALIALALSLEQRGDHAHE